jgi:hypothetical protein
MIAHILALMLVLGLAFGTAGGGEPSTVLTHPVDIERPPPAFVAVNKLLRAAKCIRADFAEEKAIKVLKRPVQSNGSLIFSGKLGLYRATQTPFVQELLVTSRGIAQRDASGKVESMDVEKMPLAKGFIDAFLLVFSGDDKALAADFDLFFEGEEGAWTLGFVPKKKPLSRFIKSLVVQGKRGVLESLTVLEVNGDQTSTRFGNVVTDKELTEDEQKRCFGWQK